MSSSSSSSSSAAPASSSTPAPSSTPPPSSSIVSSSFSGNASSYAPPTGNNGETQVIDDTSPSITYAGGQWTSTNNSLAYNNTEHQTTCKTCPATILFNGTGISLTSLLSPNGATFFVYLDNVVSGPYILTDPTISAATVYAVEGLSATQHNATFIKNNADPDDTMFDIDSLTIISRPASGGPATVTSSGRTSQLQSQTGATETATTIPVAQASSNSAPVGAIVGGTVGGVLVLIVIVVAWMFLSKRQKVNRSNSRARRY